VSQSSSLLIATFCVTAVAGCGSSVTCPQNTATITYADVQPILKAKCTGCHATTRNGDDRHGAPDGSNYDTYADASRDAESAAETVIDGSMPYGGIISDADACAIKAWADQGAPR